MLQKFKITSYAIIVALAAVLILPVNAKAGEIGDTLLERLNDESARGNTLLKKKHLKEKEKLMQKLMDSIDPLFVENDSLRAELELGPSDALKVASKKALEALCYYVNVSPGRGKLYDTEVFGVDANYLNLDEFGFIFRFKAKGLKDKNHAIRSLQRQETSRITGY